MINARQIMEKLGISRKESVANILKNKALCKRILTEKPIRLDEYMGRKIFPRYFIINMIEAGIVSCFSNSAFKGSPRYVFENEFSNLFTECVYDRSILKNIQSTSEFILRFNKELLNEQEIDLLRSRIVYFGRQDVVEKVMKKYDLSEKYVKCGPRGVMFKLELFYRRQLTEKNLGSQIRKLRNEIKDLNKEISDLTNEINDLKAFENTLEARVQGFIDDNNLEVFVKGLGVLDTEVGDLGLPSRILSVLLDGGCRTLFDIIKGGKRSLLKMHRIGPGSILYIEEMLARYDIKLKDY